MAEGKVKWQIENKTAKCSKCGWVNSSANGAYGIRVETRTIFFDACMACFQELLKATCGEMLVQEKIKEIKNEKDSI